MLTEDLKLSIIYNLINDLQGCKATELLVELFEILYEQYQYSITNTEFHELLQKLVDLNQITLITYVLDKIEDREKLFIVPGKISEIRFRN